MKKAIILGVAGLLLLSGVANAAYLYDWDSPGPHMVFVADDPGDQPDPGKNILGVWWATDLNYHYFRMDLVSAPTLIDAGDIYGIYINSDVAGSSPFFPYVPDEVSGIDYIVDSHWNQLDDFEPIHRHMWTGATFNSTNFYTLPGADFQWTENSGSSLEWRLPFDQLPLSFAFVGAAIDVGADKTTWDVTEWGNTPEPTSMALLAMGLGGLYLKRRRRS